MKNHAGVRFERAPFGHFTAVANVMDVGSFPRGNSITYERSVPKLKRFLPEYADMGVTEIYLTNGLYKLSEMGKKVHTVPPRSPIFVSAGNAISRLGERYFTKRKWLKGEWFDDRHGSNFSTADMRVLNPDAFDAQTNEGRWAELAEFVAEARRLGIKVKVDLVPWISPDGINKDNWTWAKYHQKVPEEDQFLSDEQILEKHPGNSLVKWEEDGRRVRVLVGNFSPGVDQVDPNFSDPGYQDYLIDYLHLLIDAGVESVRVDMAHRLVSQYQYSDWSAWTRMINDAKEYATGKGQAFNFLMEAYPEEKFDWRIPFLERFPQEAVYHVDPFHHYERIAKGDGRGLFDLKLAMEHARSHPGQWWVFPTNFDEWSLKNMGGPQEAFLALLLTYARMGVPLMVDTRELMGQAGQNIPQAGGQDLDAKGNAKHPFPDAIVRGFYAFWKILRTSPRRQFMSDMKAFYENAESIEILDTPNEHRYFAVGVKTKSGEYKIRMWDFYPHWGEAGAWVGAPKSFLSDEAVALRENENDSMRKRRLRNSYVLMNHSLPRGPESLDLLTVTFKDKKWYRLPVSFGADPIARLEIHAAKKMGRDTSRVNDITSLFYRLGKPFVLISLVMTGLVSLGFPGVALPAGLLAGVFALARQEQWKERFSFAFPNMNSLPMLSTPLLQKSDQGTDSPLVSVVDARPTNLGVEFMDGKARETVETALRQMGSVPLSLKSAWLTENGKGTPVLLVDDKSVETETQKKALAASIKDKPNAVIMTNAEDLTIPGVSPERIFYRPGAFSSLRTAEGLPLGLVSISLRSLLADLTQINHNGEGLTFLHTAVTELNTDGLGNDHMDIREAAKRAWILNALFQLVPASFLNWNNIKETLIAIARNA